MRVCRYLDARTTGELGERQYLPDMTDEEKAYFESILEVFTKIKLDEGVLKDYSRLLGRVEGDPEEVRENPGE
jgi:hypothetical protein